MLWVLIRTVSLRRFFEHQKHVFRLMHKRKRKYQNFEHKIFAVLSKLIEHFYYPV